MAQEQRAPGALPEQGPTTALPQRPVFVLPPKRTIREHLVFFVTRKPLGAFGAGVAIFLIVTAVFAPLIANHDPYETVVEDIYASPGADNFFGADRLGRDVYSRLVYGARISLYVGIIASFIGCTIGMLVGVASVHFGGITDLMVQRLIDAMISFPTLILAIAIMAALGSSLNNVVIALSIVYIPSTARIMRSQFLAINEMDYILAGRAVGVGHWRLMTKHMLPNAFALYLVIVTFHLGGAIIAEASLSFLGVGVPIDVPSWGGMLSGAASQYVALAPWLAVFPGVAIAVVVFSWNVLGDALRDVLDPRLKGTN
ncbi:MAG TPA: ABC transporter permease [Dehalococcoidia bacterium]|nr:ABC transporter permease [Dehalococcoidia bacterium]